MLDEIAESEKVDLRSSPELRVYSPEKYVA